MSPPRLSWTGLLKQEGPTSLLGLGKNVYFRESSGFWPQPFRHFYERRFARPKKLEMFGRLCQRCFAGAMNRLLTRCPELPAPTHGYICSIGTSGHGLLWNALQRRIFFRWENMEYAHWT